MSEPESDDDDRWVDIMMPHGAMRVPRNSPLGWVYAPDVVAERLTKQLSTGRMNWSLTPLCDLVWMLIPEARPFVAEEAKKELDWAIEHGKFLGVISDGEVVRHLRYDLIVPALGSPDGDDLIRRCLLVLWRMLSVDAEWYANMISLEITLPLLYEGWRSELNRLAPDLMTYMRNRVSEYEEMRKLYGDGSD
ncbi:hypothetical protein [Actinokineospora diospyrosa]|uniref:Uncharacterized protein n=1 Tax=Actinokineospora diospyrosa TaxID=103728 RepID=A0ABT1IJ75_9PSEU|nr:hypothetical protein [Actinokineospora diospyrosa]MCP2272586.1 hypothetical protein [Actinokineospora diospyrosa]